jgi:DNA-binding HxlR family transcriptional regulator
VGVTNSDVRTRDPGEQCVAVNETVSLMRDKWTLLVLGALSREGSLRYNELERVVGGISQRMLTLTLKTLEQNGLVTRTVFPTVPPRVDYALSPLGRTLVVPLRGLLAWSLENGAAMAEARSAYALRVGAASDGRRR